MPFLQCPNCGNNSAKINTVMTNLESCISFLGFFLIIPGFLLLKRYEKRDELLFVQGENDAGCKICGHRFKISEARNLPLELNKYGDEYDAHVQRERFKREQSKEDELAKT